MPATVTRHRIANAAVGRPIARPLPRPVARPFAIVICAACECEAVTKPGTMPKHWATEEIGGQTYAFCPDDAADLPKGTRQ